MKMTSEFKKEAKIIYTEKFCEDNVIRITFYLFRNKKYVSLFIDGVQKMLKEIESL